MRMTALFRKPRTREEEDRLDWVLFGALVTMSALFLLVALAHYLFSFTWPWPASWIEDRTPKQLRDLGFESLTFSLVFGLLSLLVQRSTTVRRLRAQLAPPGRGPSPQS